MKKIKFDIVSDRRFPHVFRVLINKFYRNYYVLVDCDVEEPGTWQGDVFTRQFFACGSVEVMELVHSERVFRSKKAASLSVAREILRHYLYDTFVNVDLDF